MGKKNSHLDEQLFILILAILNPSPTNLIILIYPEDKNKKKTESKHFLKNLISHKGDISRYLKYEYAFIFVC